MAFDLKDIDLKADSERGSWMRLKDPRTGKPLGDDNAPPGLHILGPHAGAVQQASEQVQKDREEREAARTTYKADGTLDKRGTSTREELLEDDVKVYVAATTDWRNLAWNGTDKFSPETVGDMYRNREWAGKQVRMWMLSHENFMSGRDKD